MHFSFSLDFFPPQYFLPIGEHRSRIAHPKPWHVAVPQESYARLPEAEDPSTPFVWLAEQTAARMELLKAQSSLIDSQLAKRVSLNGKMQLIARQWDLQRWQQSIAQLRMVHIRGAKNEIINTWIFPRNPLQMPVFAAELIYVSGTVRVAFVDIQVPACSPAVADEAYWLTAALAPRFATLPCDESAPDWAIDASAGNFTYSRNVPPQQASIVQECYLAYLDSYLNGFAADQAYDLADDCTGGAQAIASERLHAYQLHHMQHSPGGNYLSKLFGAEWTVAFMNSFLFAKN